jgi:hypothetical protein
MDYIEFGLSAIIGAIIGSYITYYFTIKAKREETKLRYKEEKYSNLVVLLQGFVGVTASKETKIKFFEEYYRSWIYSSDEVITSINSMIALIRNSKGEPPDRETGREVIGNIILSMRKDLHGKTKLKYADFEYIDVLT